MPRESHSLPESPNEVVSLHSSAGLHRAGKITQIHFEHGKLPNQAIYFKSVVLVFFKKKKHT